ncbi:unnamed protein product [Plutella xylostella]|uniref:(diamondback moth) hypothetical protein n=1 Tax=Plutella xylostella TaxID=51655 RepID=A0A8S4GBW0_PLUXY|nr:unnamed protein product [Plutella xylostella]
MRWWYVVARRVYVCGASASAGGLTVSLGREAGGDFALEAGAVVLTTIVTTMNNL